MSLLSDMLAAFDRWEEWRKMRDAPGRVDALEARVAELEGLLNGKAPGDVCQYCGERACRAVAMPFVQNGHVHADMRCEKCGKRSRFITKAR